MALPNLSARDLTPELMDQPDISTPQLLSALDGLKRVHSLSATVKQVWKQIHDWTTKTGLKKVRILDIASGGGDVLVQIAELAKQKNIIVEGVGVDMNDRSCRRANELAASKNLSVKFIVQEIFLEETFQNYDIAICTLFLHHLNQAQLKHLLSLIKNSNLKLFIANDLKRSLRGYLFAFLGTKIFTRSSIVHEDALLSVKAAFTIKEINSILLNAGITNVQVLSVWPQRFMIMWNKP